MKKSEVKFGFLPFPEITALLRLASPIIAAQLMMCMNGFIDTVMSGQHSPETLSQVAIGSSMWTPLIILCSGVFGGVSALSSYAFGAGEHQKNKVLLSSAVVLSLIMGVLFSIILHYSWLILPIFNVPIALFRGVQDYVEMVAFGFTGLVIFWGLRGWVEGLHRTQPAMIASLVAILVNIPLNYALIYGWWIFPEMGAKGCGLATAISFWTFPLSFIVFMAKEKIVQSYQIGLTDLVHSWNFKTIHSILRIGGPAGISGFVEGSFFCVIAVMLAPLGAVSVAAHQIALNISSMMFMVPLGLNFALTVAVGKALGEKQDAEQLRRVVHGGFFLALVFALFSCALLWCLRDVIPHLYTSDEDVIILASQLLVLAALFQIPDGLQVAVYGILKGLQDTFIPMFITIVAYWLFGAALGYGFTYFEMFGLDPLGAPGAWVGLNIGLLVAFIAFSMRLIYIFRTTTGSPLVQRLRVQFDSV